MQQRLSLDLIRIDGDTQPRAEIDMFTVQEYAEAMQAGVAFPPVDVFHDGRHYWLAEGFHRWHAARRASLTDIEAVIYEGTVESARWFAIGANKDHGLKRTNADKRRAVEMALAAKPEMSDRAIAEYCGVSQPFVSSLRPVTTDNGYQSPRTGRDGRTTNTANIGKQGASQPTQQEEGMGRKKARASDIPLTGKRVRMKDITISLRDKTIPAMFKAVNSPHFRRSEQFVRDIINQLEAAVREFRECLPGNEEAADEADED